MYPDVRITENKKKEWRMRESNHPELLLPQPDFREKKKKNSFETLPEQKEMQSKRKVWGMKSYFSPLLPCSINSAT